MKLFVIVLLALALAGCGVEATDGQDSGVSRCEKIAAGIREGGNPPMPTRERVAAVRGDFEASNFDTLRSAGVGYTDAVNALLFGADQGLRGFIKVRDAQTLLTAACAAHGVVLTFPTAEPPALTVPTYAPPTFAQVEPVTVPGA